MNQNRRKFIKKYYFSNSSTLLIPFYFITLSLVIFLQQFQFFSIKYHITEMGLVEGLSALATGIYAFLIITVIGFIYGFLKRSIMKNIRTCSLDGVVPFIISDYDKEKVINRQKQQDKIRTFLEQSFKQKKYAFIVGESGSGKSLLLSEYEKKYETFEKKATKFSVADYLKKDDLLEKLNSIIDECKNGNINNYVVIFDQFERAIERKRSFDSIISFLNESKLLSISIAIICMNKDYVQVLEKLQSKMNEENYDFNIEYDVYFVRLLNEEKKDILDQIAEELFLEEHDLRFEFFKDLFESSDNVSMIEFNIARNFFGRTGPEEYEYILNQDDPMKSIIEEYFEKVFAALDEPDLAMVILYSLCCSNGLTEFDFKNLTFSSESVVNGLLNILRKQEIIKPISKIKESPYVMTHDYLIEYLTSYCKENLSEQVIVNTDIYCKDREKSRSKNALEKESPLSLYYRNTINKKTSSYIVSICIRLLCITILFACVIQEINGYSVKNSLGFEYEMNHNILSLTIIAMGSAVFYIYHYLFYFAKIFLSYKCTEFWICVLLILWGMTAVILAIFINGFWVSWLAIEWTMIGILHLYLSGRPLTNKNAIARLKKEGVLYLVIAFVFVALNIMVLRMGSFMYPWFIIFIIFTCLTIRQHINTDFMLAKLGNFVNVKLRDDIID